MNRFGVFAVLLLCINISRNYAHDCTLLEQGYKNYFDCILTCYKDVFKMESLSGNLCSTNVQFSGDALKGVSMKEVENSLNCIATRCKTAYPPSVCEGSVGKGTTPGVSTTNGGGASTNSDPSSTKADASSSTKSGSTLKTDANGNVYEYYYDCDEDNSDYDSYYSDSEYYSSESSSGEADADTPASGNNAAAAAAATSNDQGNDPQPVVAPAPATVQEPPAIPLPAPAPAPNNGGIRSFLPWSSNIGPPGNAPIQNNGGQAAPPPPVTKTSWKWIPFGGSSNRGELNSANLNQGRLNGGEGIREGFNGAAVNQGGGQEGFNGGTKTIIKWIPNGGNGGEPGNIGGLRNVENFGAFGNNPVGGIGGSPGRTNIRWVPPGGNSANFGALGNTERFGNQGYFGGANNAQAANIFTGGENRETNTGLRQFPTSGNGGNFGGFGNLGFGNGGNFGARGNNAALAAAVAG